MNILVLQNQLKFYEEGTKVILGQLERSEFKNRKLQRELDDLKQTVIKHFKDSNEILNLVL